MSVGQIEMKAQKKTSRLGATAFVLLLLEASGKMELNEEILHSLAYLVQVQMPRQCYPKMKWEIRANFIHSNEITNGLSLARRQGLVSAAPSVVLTERGKKHCELLEVPASRCRNELREATVATIGLSKENLHSFCVAAAALASGFAEQVTELETRQVIQRHSQYITHTTRI